MITWSNQDFPFLSANTAGFQCGNQINVPADGSETVTLTFPSSYINTPVSVVASVGSGSTWNGYQLSCEVGNITTTTFDVTVSGGPSGSTVIVYWMSQGM